MNPTHGVEPIATIDVPFGTIPLGIPKEYIPKEVVCALVDNEPYDLKRPIYKDSSLGFLSFDDERGKTVFWHSSAHVLGACIEISLGSEIAIGPVENGFFYDFSPPAEKVDQETLDKIQKLCIEMCQNKAEFERKMVTREEALEIFPQNRFKQEILTKRVKEGELVSIYRTGTFIDLCRGPHISTAQKVQSWLIKDVSGTIWNGREDQKLLRIRGITFPNKKLLAEYENFLKEAAERDHRKLGLDLELFFHHPWSPGSAFFFPAGARIYGKLIELMRGMYIKKGFVEVHTPNLFYQDLFETSGHWAHYQEDMFHFVDQSYSSSDPNAPKKEFGLKPMNCPGHCLIFRQIYRSYRDLPIRMAEFGVLHRNEASGALTGLTRVRRFVQDDAHIFLRKDQIGQEMASAIDFVQEIYSIFGMSIEFTLSTKNPEKYMGDDALWENAENLLRSILTERKLIFTENPGDAAFYGPKIDIKVKDCLGRMHQLATIQLDFNLPIRFELFYIDENNQKQNPVMIHRAILGSLERFFALAIEHYAGRFPFWLSPRQICIIPQNESKEEHIARCNELKEKIYLLGFAVQTDQGPETMKKKIVNAFKMATNCVVIIGDKEIANNTVSVRWRAAKDDKAANKVITLPYDEFIQQIQQMVKDYQ